MSLNLTIISCLQVEMILEEAAIPQSPGCKINPVRFI
jgi:hypothetical protein